DLALLARFFLERLKKKRPTRFEGLTPEALEVMRHYRWPGNVRELENVMERIVTLNDDVRIRPEHLPPEWTVASTVSAGSLAALPPAGVLESGEKDLILRVLKESQFNKQKAAKRLGISRPTLYQKIRKYQISIE